MADFTVLSVYHGVGDYHFNRYRVVFQSPPAQTKQLLANKYGRASMTFSPLGVG